MSARARPDAEDRRRRRLLAAARLRAVRPVPGADGRLPDFDDPCNLITLAEVRASLGFAAGLAEAERPKRRS